MKVIYQDEYGNNLLHHSIILDAGDMIEIDKEDWIVKNKFYYSTEDVLVITVTQNLLKSKIEDNGADRLAEVKSSIMQINKRQDAQEKQARLLREQLVSVRSYLRSQPRTTK